MTEIVKKVVLQLMTEECFDKFFVDFNFLDVACFKAVLSKGLGIGLILGSILVKVPQILKILGNKSGDGINIFSVLLDLFAITCHMSYSFVSGFPFTAWGDGTFLAIQTALIAVLVMYYSGKKVGAGIFIIIYLTICYVLMGGMTPREYLWSAQAFNVPVLLVGKSIQAVTNFKNKSTGQLSAATCILLFAGSSARIFTSVQETGDFMMILTYVVSTLANFVIVFQLFYYSKSGKSKADKEKPSGGKKLKPKSKKVD